MGAQRALHVVFARQRDGGVRPLPRGVDHQRPAGGRIEHALGAAHARWRGGRVEQIGHHRHDVDVARRLCPVADGVPELVGVARIEVLVHHHDHLGQVSAAAGEHPQDVPWAGVLLLVDLDGEEGKGATLLEVGDVQDAR